MYCIQSAGARERIILAHDSKVFVNILPSKLNQKFVNGLKEIEYSTASQNVNYLTNKIFISTNILRKHFVSTIYI